MDATGLFEADERPYVVSRFTAFVALIYHFSFIFVFYGLKVYPMSIFNIGSSIIFFTSTFFIKKVKSITPLFFMSEFEVIFHQIFADYFLGANTGFHFFLLIISYLPYFIYTKHLKIAIVFSIIPLLIFSIIEICAPFIQPLYIISTRAEYTIKIINILVTIFVTVGIIYTFAKLVMSAEDKLENEVQIQAEKLQLQNEKIIGYQKNTILSLSNLVENRDNETGEHVRRTSAYVHILAKAAQINGLYPEILSNNYIDNLYKAAPMHDIGKIVISDLILKKPGKLTQEEFDQMKRHAPEGGRIIKEILENSDDDLYKKLAIEIATSHHEKWDGTGYPDHLAGDEIPLSARLMAIADVFDALVTSRCYKEAYSIDEAFKIIEESGGSHFDPTLSKVFVENRKAILNILARYAE
ncbi:MAG: HD domain-containing protein [Treponema sp.]|nr:HD domain-containing protein [Candidatus Treponema merdequi]